jgi:hypothetical protein
MCTNAAAISKRHIPVVAAAADRPARASLSASRPGQPVAAYHHAAGTTSAYAL